jgi:hypothetical protein
MKILSETLTPVSSKYLVACTDGVKFYVKVNGRTSAARTFSEEHAARECFRNLYKNDN